MIERSEFSERKAVQIALAVKQNIDTEIENIRANAKLMASIAARMMMFANADDLERVAYGENPARKFAIPADWITEGVPVTTFACGAGHHDPFVQRAVMNPDEMMCESNNGTRCRAMVSNPHGSAQCGELRYALDYDGNS